MKHCGRNKHVFGVVLQEATLCVLGVCTKGFSVSFASWTPKVSQTIPRIPRLLLPWLQLSPPQVSPKCARSAPRRGHLRFGGLGVKRWDSLPTRKTSTTSATDSTSKQTRTHDPHWATVVHTTAHATCAKPASILKKCVCVGVCVCVHTHICTCIHTYYIQPFNVQIKI
jgi:hypothetical protein